MARRLLIEGNGYCLMIYKLKNASQNEVAVKKYNTKIICQIFEKLIIEILVHHQLSYLAAFIVSGTSQIGQISVFLLLTLDAILNRASFTSAQEFLYQKNFFYYDEYLIDGSL